MYKSIPLVHLPNSCDIEIIESIRFFGMKAEIVDHIPDENIFVVVAGDVASIWNSERWSYISLMTGEEISV